MYCIVLRLEVSHLALFPALSDQTNDLFLAQKTPHFQIYHISTYLCFSVSLRFCDRRSERWEASSSWDNHVRRGLLQTRSHSPQLSNRKRRLSNWKRWFEIMDRRQICHQIDSRANIRLTWDAMGGPNLRWGLESNPTEEIDWDIYVCPTPRIVLE